MNWTPFEEFVAVTMKEENIPGLAVAVSLRGKIIYQRGFGVRNITTAEPATPQTVFGIASVTKSFTALAIMQLAQQGKLAVNDAVNVHLPEFVLSGVKDEDMASIKIHHLLSHTTGIPPMRRRQDLSTFAQHLEFLANEDVSVLGAPGDYFSYCNDAFLLLGAIIERITGQSYRAYMTEHILKPLGMSESTFNVAELEDREDVSTPYIFNKKESVLEEQPWPALGNYEVGGGVRSCALDLLKYGQAYFSERIVPATSASLMYQPIYAIGQASHYGYALKVTQNHGGFTLVEHGGGQPGVSANFGFVPEQELVVAVLTNITGASAARIWLAAVNTCLSMPLNYSLDHLTLQEVPPNVVKYAGTYQSDEGGKITVSTREGGLQVEFEGETYDLNYAGDTTFFFKYRGQRVVKFYVDPSGEPWAAFVGLRMLKRFRH